MSKMTKITSVLVSLSTGLMMSGAVAVMPIIASADTISDLQASITALQAQLAALIASQGGSAATCSYTFSSTLKQGSTGTEVMNLQKVLNMSADTQVSTSGAGSPGNETSYFGSKTKAAVIKFQNKYAADILTPIGLSTGTGLVGSMTRAKLNAICTAQGPGPGPIPTPGTGLTVTAGIQPTATLAVGGAARMAFTKFTVTAGSDGDVTMNSVVIERTGLMNDAVFSSVILMDENGTQLGLSKTLNSLHQATVGEAVVIPKGTSKTFTIAGNMAASLASYAGEAGYISLVSINTSATVTGTLPITGAMHTINGTLSIGSITAARGPLDPNSAATKNVGTTGYTFSSVKITAGSTEKIRLHSVRWNQASSAAGSDLANVKVYVEETAYDATLSADSKYYTANFSGGILIDKGLSKEISIKADIVGGSGRTIAFSIEKTTDIYLTGETYGYGITPPTTGTGITSGNIWFAGSTVTVANGSITVNQDTSVASQNIATNLSNQPLAGLKVTVQGEEVTVGSIVFDIATTTGTWGGLLTNVSLYNSNGAVVAGPIDEVATAAGSAALTFTDSVTFPIGTNTYTVKGKTPSTVANNGTYRLTTDPATNWTTVTGQTTGNTITPGPSGDQALQTMVVKAAALEVSTSANPAAQSMVAGSQDFTFANIVFDATGSGEDIKFSTFPVNISMDGTVTDLSDCKLVDGSTALNTGSNAVDVSAAASSTTFTLNSNLIITKGTVKTLAVQCDLADAASANESIYVSYASGASATGMTSGQSVTITATAAAGSRMTVVAAGTFTVTLDASSPGYGVIPANTTGNTVSIIKFTGTNEPINLSSVHLQLTNTASSSASDITQLTLWDGAIQVGSAVFTGSNTAATATISNFTIPKDGSKKMTIKADFPQIGTGQPITVGGHFIAVDYDGGELTGTTGTGAQSGDSINSTSGSDSASAGIRLFKSIPTITKVTLPSSTADNGSKTLLRWKVSGDSKGDVGVSKFTITLATTTITVTGVNVFAYSDSGYNVPVTGLGASDGRLLVTNELGTGDTAQTHTWVDSTSQINFSAETSAEASTTIQVPAGGSIYFEAKGTIAGSATGASVTATLQGDSSYPTWGAYSGGALYTAGAAMVDEDTHDDFIWSSNATQTDAVVADGDWTNGYGILTTDYITDTLSK